MLRGVAVLLVVLSHADAYEMILPQTQYVLFFKSALGKVGVMLFFVISGYLIWQSATRCFNKYPHPWQQFALLRTARIAPLYLAGLLAVCMLSEYFHAAFKPQITLNNLLRHITFSQDLNPSVARTLNPVLWSLTHEAIFYCIVPLLFVFSTKYSRFFTWLVVGSLGLMVLAILFPNFVLSNFFKYSILFVVGILTAKYQYYPSKSLSAVFLISGLFFTLFSTKQYDFYGYLVIASSIFFLLLRRGGAGALEIGCATHFSRLNFLLSLYLALPNSRAFLSHHHSS